MQFDLQNTSIEISAALTGLMTQMKKIPEAIQVIDTINFFNTQDNSADQANTLSVQDLQTSDDSSTTSSVKGMVMKNINQHLSQDSDSFLEKIKSNHINKVILQSLQELPSEEDNRAEVGNTDDDDNTTEGGPCKKFHETEMEQFFRLNQAFKPGTPQFKIDPSDLGTTEALKWYGIIMQGQYGDNKTAAPSWFDLVERLKWNSYEGRKGMDKHEARMMLINGAIQMLGDRGFSSEHPEKEQMDQDYAICVKEKLAAGMNQEEIDEQSENWQNIVNEKKAKEDEGKTVDLAGYEYTYSPYSNLPFLHNHHTDNSAQIIKYGLASSAIVIASQILI